MLLGPPCRPEAFPNSVSCSKVTRTGAASKKKTPSRFFDDMILVKIINAELDSFRYLFYYESPRASSPCQSPKHTFALPFESFCGDCTVGDDRGDRSGPRGDWDGAGEQGGRSPLRLILKSDILVRKQILVAIFNRGLNEGLLLSHLNHTSAV